MPGLTQASILRFSLRQSPMDCRGIGERSDAVLRTAMPGNDDAEERSRNAIRVGVACRASCELRESLFAIHHSPLAFFFPQIKREGGTPANAGYHRRILRCGARPFGARTPDGVPPRLSPKGIIPSQRLGFRPGFLGLGLNGRYPPSPVPVQGCTSHPGHNAGRHDAQAAREQAAKPPAGTALAPMTRCASAPCPSRSEDYDVTGIETNVKEKVTTVARMERSAI